LRRAVPHDSHAERTEVGCEAKVELGVVDQERGPRSLGARTRHELFVYSDQLFQSEEGLGQAEGCGLLEITDELDTLGTKCVA
jgi:hypothetical protein